MDKKKKTLTLLHVCGFAGSFGANDTRVSESVGDAGSELLSSVSVFWLLTDKVGFVFSTSLGAMVVVAEKGCREKRKIFPEIVQRGESDTENLGGLEKEC